MCGICGIAYSEPIGQIERKLAGMSSSIAHRGPDAHGTFLATGVALAHRRLSILELTEAGAQPMKSKDGAVVVSYNGEVFNFGELRHDLQIRGHQFIGRSDTEVILAAYQEWGKTGLEKLEGMFAIALWDNRRSNLLLMRDRLGIKPLFYALTGSSIVFGSEIKVILKSGLIEAAADRQATAEYMWFGNAHEDRTIYSRIRSLQPGHRLIWSARGGVLEKWWEVEQWLEVPESDAIRRDPIGAVRGSIDAAVKRQLVADVPVGLFLSGGIDSTAIAVSAVSSQEGRRTRSFAAGFGAFGSTDERSKARRVAETLGMPHESVDIGEFDLEAVVRAMVEAHDEPFADAANIPLYVLSRRVSKTVKVVLQGDGGDELFGGYRRYLLLRHLSAWRKLPNFMLRNSFLDLLPVLQRFGRIAKSLRMSDAAMRMALLLTTDTLTNSTIQYFNGKKANRIVSGVDPFLAYRRAAIRFGRHDPVVMMQLTDLTTQLPHQFLPKVDRATMANGVEARVPLLDEIVCKTALNLPLAFRVKGLQKKLALRASLRTRIPKDIIDAPKTGFSVPYAAWLAGPLRGMAERALLSRQFLEQFDLDLARVRGGLDQLSSGKGAQGYQLWKLFQFALWAEKNRDTNG